MNILIVGNGARENAIALKLKESKKVDNIYSLPKNPGIDLIGKSYDINVLDFDKILNLCFELKIDFVVIGPEVPLVNGLADLLIKNNIKVFGPNKEASKLEGSKAFSKEFMKKYNVPTAKSKECHSFLEAKEALKEFTYPLVIKASGLAAGKGVVIVNDEDEAITTLNDMMINHSLKDAGDIVVIEEFLKGYECSLLCFCDGKTMKKMVYAKDHKQIYDGNKGPNTGGMGTVSPNPFLNIDEKIIDEKIIKPILNGFKESNLDYRGVLFIGLMIDKDEPKVLEFNVRFGDPETQVILLRLETDLLDIMLKTYERKLDEIDIKWNDKHALCLVLASNGYPSKYETNKEIFGLEDVKDAIILHAGTKSENGKIYTNGGRVLNICTTGSSLNETREKAYKEADKIHFEGKVYRKDIGLN